MGNQLHDEIARRAYELFEARGREHGCDWHDWFEAERSVRESRRPWRVEAPQASLTGDIDTTTLVLRLGIAVNAVRAAQRFFYASKDAVGPAGERDRLWAFLIALGFLHEAIELLRYNFPKVRTLAKAGGAAEEVIIESGRLLSGRLPITQTFAKLRNTLIFHWDDGPIREFVMQYSKNSVVWAEGLGDTRGEMLYRTAADALTHSVLPDDLQGAQPESPERSAERIKDLLADVLEASARVIEFFDCAIKDHLMTTGAQKELM